MKSILLIGICICHYFVAIGQNQFIEGYIYESSNTEKAGLYGANIVSDDGLHGTTSDKSGYFKLNLPDSYQKVMVSYIGYKNEVIKLPSILSQEIFML